MTGGGEAGRGRGAPEDPGMFATAYHAPVLCKAVVDGLVTNRDGTYVDATLGGGGHAAALLRALSPSGRVFGIDQDSDAIRTATARLRDEIEAGRFVCLKGNFRDLDSILAEQTGTIDGLLLDLGVSSHQLDRADRGFSYSAPGELDMRMDADAPFSARDLVNETPEAELRQILFELGEEPRARRIASAIVRRRPLETTGELADVVRGAVPASEAVKSLSRVFQAFRIAVNDELGALEQALQASQRLVRPGGRVAVLSYHSLEDRRAKRFLRFGNLRGEPVRDLYGNPLAPWRELNRRPITPDEDEVAMNPRSRSARLRIAERVEDR
jgi:16S rRNA (cytosine1402-N4)-methyltransferase